MAGPLRRVRENATEVVSVLVTGLWLAALFTGQGWWLPFMLFGYVVVVPLTALLFGDREDIAEWWNETEPSTPERSADRAASGEDDPLQTLRNRYARGELTDAEFERKVERLLETEESERTTAEPLNTTGVEREIDRE
jgi:uncharacterized membrane protein